MEVLLWVGQGHTEGAAHSFISPARSSRPDIHVSSSFHTRQPCITSLPQIMISAAKQIQRPRALVCLIAWLMIYTFEPIQLPARRRREPSAKGNRTFPSDLS